MAKIKQDRRQMVSELVGWRHFISWGFKLLSEWKKKNVIIKVEELWEIYFFTQRNRDNC
jgi:hypothetical protein